MWTSRYIRSEIAIQISALSQSSSTNTSDKLKFDARAGSLHLRHGLFHSPLLLWVFINAFTCLGTRCNTRKQSRQDAHQMNMLRGWPLYFTAHRKMWRGE